MTASSGRIDAGIARRLDQPDHAVPRLQIAAVGDQVRCAPNPPTP
jgi:hypothetical protein